MKVIRFRPPGGVDRLCFEDEDMPAITPSSDEVLIQVKATSIIATEIFWPIYQLPSGEYTTHIPGHDFAGVVTHAPANNTRGIKPGDEVMCFTSNRDFEGAMAEYAKALLSEVVRKPASLNWIEAASVPLSALTAWQALFQQGNLRPGQKLLIVGAAGVTGLWAVQIAKKIIGDVVVVGTASSPRSFELLKEVGIDQIVDYKNQKVEEMVSDVDLVLDTVYGGSPEASLKTLKPGGLYLSIVDPSAGDKAAALSRNGKFFIVKNDMEQLERVGQLLDEGVLKTFIDSVFEFEDVHQAFGKGLAAVAHGKIVLRVSA